LKVTLSHPVGRTTPWSWMTRPWLGGMLVF